MQRDILQRTVIAEVDKVWKSAKRKKVCMHPEAPAYCSKHFGKAHSVQRSKLKRIATNGKVLKVATDSMTGSLSVEPVGIKPASTFYGFCNSHDDSLFAPIEKSSLKLNKESALLLAYRGMSIHMYYKRRRDETDLFHTMSNDSIPQDLKRNDLWIRLGLSRLLHFAEPAYGRMGRAILQRDFSQTYFVALIFNCVPDILCSEASIINYGFEGNLVRERPQPYDFMSLSLLPYKQHFGIAVFAWHGKSKTNESFVRSLLSLDEREIPDAIVRFAFRYQNNFFFAPKWWRRLSPVQQKNLFARATDRTMFVDLRPDGNRYVDWKVTDIKPT